MNHQRVKLGEICDFLYGDGLPEAQRKGGAIPVYGSNGIVGWHNRSRFGHFRGDLKNWLHEMQVFYC